MATINKNFEVKDGLLVGGAASAIGLIVRGNATTPGNLQEWQISDGTVRATLRTTGALNLGTLITGTQLSVTPFNNTTTGIVVRGAASQSNNLQEWQNSSGTLLSWIHPAGYLTLGSATTIGGVLGISTGVSTARGIVVRGAASQSVNLQEWQNSAGTALTNIDLSGRINSTIGLYTSGKVSVGGASWSGGSAMLNVWTTATSTPGIIIRGVASQTGNLQEWQNSAGTVIASIGSAGSITTTSNITQSASGRTFIGGAADYGAFLNVNTPTATRQGLVVRANASQSANIQEWQNSAGTVLSGINAAGQIYSGTTTSINGSTTTAITSAAYTSDTVAVFTYGGTSLVQAGQRVTVAGVTGGTYNGTWTVTAVTSTTFTVLGSGFTDVSGTGGTFTLSAVGSFVAGTAAITPIVVQGAASQTARLQEWRDSAGNLLSWIDSTGSIFSVSGATTRKIGWNTGSAAGDRAIIATDSNGSMFFRVGSSALLMSLTAGLSQSRSVIIQNSTVDYTSLIVKGSAAQTANLQEWQNSAGTVVVSINPSGTLVASSGIVANSGMRSVTSLTTSTVTGTTIVSNATTGHLILQDITTAPNLPVGGGVLYVESGALKYRGASGIGVQLEAYAATDKPLIVKSFAAQTANLQEWQNSSGTILSAIDISGNLTKGDGDQLVLAGQIFG
jgi:hypothetical protein